MLGDILGKSCKSFLHTHFYPFLSLFFDATIFCMQTHFPSLFFFSLCLLFLWSRSKDQIANWILKKREATPFRTLPENEKWQCFQFVFPLRTKPERLKNRSTKVTHENSDVKLWSSYPRPCVYKCLSWLGIVQMIFISVIFRLFRRLSVNFETKTHGNQLSTAASKQLKISEEE